MFLYIHIFSEHIFIIQHKICYNLVRDVFEEEGRKALLHENNFFALEKIRKLNYEDYTKKKHYLPFRRV